MTRSTEPSTRPSRRSVLGLLAATPVAAGGVLAASGPAYAEPPSGGAVPKDLMPGGRFDRFVAEQAARDQFSGSLLLTHKGVPVLARCYGMADKKRAIPNRPDTIFNLASVSKSFTAVAVTQLVQQGKVVLHETIGTYLDGFLPEIAERVTVHQLFTNTSGLDDFTSSREWQEQHKKWDTPEEEFEGTLAIVRKQKPLALPGVGYKYCNSDYFILGAIVARISGMSFQDYVRRHVFAAAGMRDADYYTRSQVLHGRKFAHAYGPPGPNGQRPDLTTTGKGEGGFGTGASGASATLGDLVRYVRALYDGTLLDPTYTELLTSGKYPINPEDGKPSHHAYDDWPLFAAYGVDQAIVNDQRVIVRTGGGPMHGVAAYVSVYPDLDWVAVVLFNYYADLVAYLELQDELITKQGVS